MSIRNFLSACLATVFSLTVQALDMPPRNPWLADSSCPMGHGDSAQQDSVSQNGPSGPSRILLPEEIQYRHIGPAHFGAQTSGVYANGKRVFWSNGLDRIAKVDFDSYEVLDEYFFPGTEPYDATRADKSIADFDANNSGFTGIFRAFREMSKLRDLAGVYTVLDRDNVYYIDNKDGLITAYTDADPRDSTSAIVKRAEFQLPANITGTLVGMNMSYDGWLVVATEHGYLVAIKRDFSESRSVKLLHSERSEDKATGPGKGWVRNGFAIDEHGADGQCGFGPRLPDRRA